jgi:uncharacterized protein (UPF0303 family)
MAEKNGSKITDWKLDPNDYCLGGGGYPIKIKNTGMAGAILATGTNDIDEHDSIVAAIREYKGMNLPALKLPRVSGFVGIRPTFE